MDADEDGLTTCNGDCDDNEPNIKKIKQYEDIDGDGYGVSTTWTYSCFEIEGHSPLSGDCNDNDASLNKEDYDGDGLSTCNGDCDDTDSDIKRIRVYADSDGDGSGDSTTFLYSCFDVEGYVFEKGDCDDNNADIHGLDLDEDGLTFVMEIVMTPIPILEKYVSMKTWMEMAQEIVYLGKYLVIQLKGM